MPKIRTNETYVSVRDFARGHGIDPAVFLEQVKRHIYDSGITLDDRIWSDNLVKVYNKMNNEGRAANEATLMIRGGKPTGLLEVVGRIAQAKNKARAQNLQGIYSHYMALSQLLTNTAGIKRELVLGKPYYEYSVTDDLYRQYMDACKALKLDYYTLDGQLVRNGPSKPAEPPKPATSPNTGACIPFEQCFYAKCWPDAEDYDGDPEYSWIKPGDLKKTLGYFDPEGDIWDDDKSYDGFLDRYMPDLKAAYEKAVKEYAATGKAKAIEVGSSYDRVPKDLVPGLTTLYTVWPRPEARGARYQRECSLYMAIGPRDKFKF